MTDLITTEGSFEWAMLQLKEGKRVAREGWNGKNMYLLRNPGLTGQSVQEGDYRALAGVEVGTEFDFLANIEMCNADGNFVPWVSSQADVKTSDWSVIGEEIDADYYAFMDITIGRHEYFATIMHGYSKGVYGAGNLYEHNTRTSELRGFRLNDQKGDEPRTQLVITGIADPLITSNEMDTFIINHKLIVFMDGRKYIFNEIERGYASKTGFDITVNVDLFNEFKKEFYNNIGVSRRVECFFVKVF